MKDKLKEDAQKKHRLGTVSKSILMRLNLIIKNVATYTLSFKFSLHWNELYYSLKM